MKNGCFCEWVSHCTKDSASAWSSDWTSQIRIIAL